VPFLALQSLQPIVPLETIVPLVVLAEILCSFGLNGF